YQAFTSRTNSNPAYQLNGGWESNRFEICRIDPKTNQCTPLSTLQRPAETTQSMTGYSFSPDGARVALTFGSTSSRPDNNAPSIAALYETATGRIIGKPLQHDGNVFSPCYSPDGKWFITISDDRTVRRWDGQTGAPMGEPIRLPRPSRF